MIVAESCYDEMINSVARTIHARVELLEGSTLLDTYTYDGALQSFVIERQGNPNKFFGYGVCQKLTVKLRDKERLININKGQQLDVAVGVGCEYLYTCPVFYVDEVQRDENTNALTITAYDAIYKTNSYKVSDLTLPEDYTILYFISAAAALLGISVRLEDVNTSHFMTNYVGGANFDGSESLREALDDVAEVTGTIYYLTRDWELTFKQMDIVGEPVLTIDKSKYFTLSAKTPYNLETLTHATELGDNITVETGLQGAHQYLRDNAFLNNRNDAYSLLYNVFYDVAGLTMHQFDCKWRGNFLLEIGDKIGLVTKDNETIYSYLLNDTITYNGGLVGNTSWSYTSNDSETASNPVTLGEALNQTVARVDKVNKEILLMVQDTNEMKSTINSIKIDTDNITLKTESLYDDLSTELTIRANEIRSEVNDSINDLHSRINQTSSEIRSEVSDKVEKVNSTITQTANSIRSEVRGELDAQDQVISSIQQDLDGISLTYNSTNGTASITIGDVTVTNLVDGKYVEEAVAGITITGYVTFNDLKTSGSTIINGSNITTGTIAAERINLSGAISWGDLTTACKNTIKSYAGADGSDANVPDYIHSTYIDETTIYSPTIYGAEIYAGTASDGYIAMTSTGMNFVSAENGNLVGIGYYSGNYDYPYIVLGQGVDDSGTDKGLIKKYANGIWIGDSDSMNASNPSATSVGLFIDFTNGKMYRYNGSGTRAELV